MRQVLSISLPGQIIQKIKQRSKKRGFASVSHYIKYLLEGDDDLISEQELLEDIKAAEKEYKEGKTIKAKSLAEFL